MLSQHAYSFIRFRQKPLVLVTATLGWVVASEFNQQKQWEKNIWPRSKSDTTAETQAYELPATLTSTTPWGVWSLPVADTNVDDGWSSLLFGFSFVK